MRPWHGIVAAVVVVAGALLAWWLLRGNGTQDDEEARKARGLIKEVAPAKAPAAEPEKVATNTVKKHKFPIHVDERGVRRYSNGVRVYDEKTPMRKPTTPFGDKPIFKHWTLNELASFITLQPGGMLFGTRKYDEKYLEKLKKGLAEEIVINEDDDEKTKQIKQEMMDVQRDFRKMSDKEILATVQDTYSELMRLARYKNDVQQMVKDAIRERGDMTEQDYQDVVNAANEMLKKEGIAPIRNSVLIRKNIKLMHQKRQQLQKGDKKQ